MTDIVCHLQGTRSTSLVDVTCAVTNDCKCVVTRDVPSMLLDQSIMMLQLGGTPAKSTHRLSLWCNNTPACLKCSTLTDFLNSDMEKQIVGSRLLHRPVR